MAYLFVFALAAYLGLFERSPLFTLVLAWAGCYAISSFGGGRAKTAKG